MSATRSFKMACFYLAALEKVFGDVGVGELLHHVYPEDLIVDSLHFFKFLHLGVVGRFVLILIH